MLLYTSYNNHSFFLINSWKKVPPKIPPNITDYRRLYADEYKHIQTPDYLKFEYVCLYVYIIIN